ncbi:MAG: hypothetical protein GXP43_02855 [bacterium]|nr:hypothetical protein [bacterium]
MIKIDDNLLNYLFNLARIPASRLSLVQKQKLKKDLNTILGYINKLNKLDTSSVKPFHRPYPLEDIGHDDQPDPSSQTPIKFANQKDGYLIVNRIIDKDNED